MDRLAADAIVDLVAAACAVGDDEVVAGGLAERWEERQLGHGEGDVDGLRVVAEGAGHAAAGLLVAVAVEMRLAALLVAQGEGGGAGGDVLRQQLLDEERRRGERRDLGLRQEVQELVAEGVEAGRLEPDDAAARRDERRQRVERAPRLFARLLDQARREEGAAAAQGTALRPGVVKAVARRGEDALGGGEILGLEVAVEGVAEEDEIAAVAAHGLGGGGPARLEPRPLPCRHRAAGGKAQRRLRGAGGAGDAVAEIENAPGS